MTETTSPQSHLATISILVKEREAHSAKVNEILSLHGDRILARLGVNLGHFGNGITGGLITIAVEGAAHKLRAITDELDTLYGVVAKMSVLD